jgi:hypothetical protein
LFLRISVKTACSYGWSVLFVSLSQPLRSAAAVRLLPSRNSSFLDTSWQVVLEYAAEHHLQFGKEIVFTYGPLGYLLTDVSLGHMLNERIVFAFALSLFMAWSVVGVARRLVGTRRYLFLAWALLFGTFSSGADNFFFLIILYGGFLMLGQKTRKLELVAFLIMLAVLSLTKFIYFFATLAVILIALRCRSSGIRISSKEYSLALVGLWFLWPCGRQPASRQPTSCPG